MIQDTYGQLIFSERDYCDLLLQGHAAADMNDMIVSDFTLDSIRDIVTSVPRLRPVTESSLTLEQFDSIQQQTWRMPPEYQNFNIAEYILDRCESEAALQRAGHELLLFAERDLIPLLQYLKYLVDTMSANNIIWGVGRGSSVSSYVLYLLGVHRVDSLYYELDIHEFLR